MPLSCRARHRETSPYRAQEAGPPSRALAVGPASILGPKTLSSFSRGGPGPGRIPTGQAYMIGGFSGPATKGQIHIYI